MIRKTTNFHAETTSTTFLWGVRWVDPRCYFIFSLVISKQKKNSSRSLRETKWANKFPACPESLEGQNSGGTYLSKKVCPKILNYFVQSKSNLKSFFPLLLLLLILFMSTWFVASIVANMEVTNKWGPEMIILVEVIPFWQVTTWISNKS